MASLQERPPPIKRGSFIKEFGKDADKVSDKVRLYLEDPDQENIHDVRTGIRRLDTCFRLLPGDIRKKPKVSAARRRYKSLFRVNSEIRDIDVILSKFKEYPDDATSRHPDFQDVLHRQRDRKLDKAWKIAVRVNDQKLPGITKAKVSKKRLRRRFQKVVGRFAGDAQSLFPVVASDSSRDKDLHELRKDCKKLRYTLEVLDSNSKEVKGMIGFLQEVQDQLGTIHDCDIMLQYLRGDGMAKRSGDYYPDLVTLEENKREKLYYQFASKYGGDHKEQDLAVSGLKIAAA